MRTTRTIPVNNSTASPFLFEGNSGGGQVNSLFKTSTSIMNNNSTTTNINNTMNSLLTPSSEILLDEQHNSLLDDEFQDDFNSGFEDTTTTNNQRLLYQSSATSNPIFMMNNTGSTSPTSSSSEAFQFSSLVDDDDAGQTTSDSYISSSSHLSLTPPGLTFMMSQHSIQPNNNHYNQAPLMNNYSPLLNHNVMNPTLQNNLFQQQLLNMTQHSNEQMFLNEDLLTNSREDVEPLLEDQEMIANLSNTLLFQQQLQKLQQQQQLLQSTGINIPLASNSIPRSKPQIAPQQQMLNNTQQYINQYNMSLIEEMLLNGTIPPSTNLEELQQAILRASASNLLPSTPPSVSSSPPSAFHLQQQNLALSRQLAQQQQVVASMIGSQMRSLQVVQELIQQQQQQQNQQTQQQQQQQQLQQQQQQVTVTATTPTSTTSSSSSITRSKTMPSISSAASTSNIIPISTLYPQSSNTNNRNQRPKPNLPKQPTEQPEVPLTEENEESNNKNSIDLDDAYENYALNSNNISSVELYNTMMNTLQQNQKLLANAYGNLANLANTISQQQNVVSGMKRSTSTTSVCSNTSSSSQTSGYPYSSIPFSPMSRSQSMNCLSSLNTATNNLHIPTDSSLTSFGEQAPPPEKPSSSSEMKRSMSTSSMRNLKRTKTKKMPPTRSSDNLTGLLERETDKETSKKRKNSNFNKKGRKKNHSESSNDLLSLEKIAEAELNNTEHTEPESIPELPTPTDSTHSADFIEETTFRDSTRPKAKSVKIGGVIGGVRKAHSMDSIALAAQNQQQFAPMDPPSEPKQKAIKAKSKKIAFQNESQQPAVPGAGMFVMSSFQPPPQCQGRDKRWKFHEFDNEDKPIKDNDSGFTFHFYKPSKN